MAFLYITEYAAPAYIGGLLPVGAEPHITTQVIAIGASSAQSAAFANNTSFVRLHSDAVCSVLFGTNPTSIAATSPRMAANQTEYFSVPVGAGYKVANIATTP
jgi:hypothetical protein